jgi:osmotically-inducible protein OsmY
VIFVNNQISVRESILRDDLVGGNVALAFKRDAVVPADTVNVTVADGRAFLDGTVSSRFARERAEQLAAQTRGVRAITNRIEIR